MLASPDLDHRDAVTAPRQFHPADRFRQTAVHMRPTAGGADHRRPRQRRAFLGQ